MMKLNTSDNGVPINRYSKVLLSTVQKTGSFHSFV